ncbi:DUF4142 domain-containing protein [Segetibacter sp. 3557_3]|uniref:DUF4142 domain-containing protein n=1 Tax=Segetibacter sp. 3557_3 TaxID=2547429 RepID=UPI0010588D90|nr:DUF4142 domain-containing protein [Segetibacter sp. 3557_3]TDH21481.1 DUF4142 domain-containing protein [Segetibacter sp. 3557_3]
MKMSIKALAVVFASGIIATSCNSGSDTSGNADSSTVKTNDTGAGAADTGTGAMSGMNTGGNPNQDVINTMVTKNDTEMAWLKAGMNNGTNAQLKSHAKMMLAEHQALGKKVTALVQQKGLTAPTVDTTGAVTLTEAKGKEWDKAWTDKMVAEHQDLLEKLNSAETTVTDEDLKNIVTSTKPVVQKHLDMAKAMQGKM